MPPIASIVIPAHNEASVISQCLSVFAHDVHNEWEVIVVCNGCSDDTANVARKALPNATVIEITTASKAAALNAGDATATTFPRIYLDADVQVSETALRATVNVLQGGSALVAAPRPYFETTRSPYFIRAFYRAWERSDFLKDGVIGNGMYAISASGRKRFGEFPNLFGDDFLVYSLFRTGERVTLTDYQFVIHPPRSFAGLLNVRTRVYYGNAQFEAANIGVEKVDDSTASALGLLKRSRSLRTFAEAMIYLTMNALAKARAVARLKRNRSVKWDRDATSRSRPMPG
jgi:glycosyltransferase involved in cell wall biosynthesis